MNSGTCVRVRTLSAQLLRSRVLGEGVWVAAGQILSAVAALASVRIMTELLTPTEFGRLTLLLGVATLALGLSANPRFQALIRYYPDCVRDGRVGALRRIGIRLVARIVALTAAAIALGWLVAGPQLGDKWFTGLLIAALLIIDSVRSFELGLFNAARRQRVSALVYTVDAWSRPLMAIAAVLAFGSSADAALAGYVAGSGLVVLAMIATIQLEGRDAQSVVALPDAGLAEKLRNYALPLVPLALFGWLSGMGDRYVIAGVLSVHDAGLYAAAYSLASRPFLMLASIVELTMRPVLQNAVASGQAALVSRTKAVWLLTTGIGAVLGILGFFLLSGPVGDLLLAAEFRSATVLMPWIALGYALYVVSNVFSRFCYTFDDTKAALILTVAGAVIGISVSIPAVIFLALAGAAAAVPVRFAIELTLSMILARRAERRFVLRTSESTSDQ